MFGLNRNIQTDKLNCFPSKIYFDNLKDMSKPTFTFISDQNKFGIPHVFRMIRRQTIRYFIIVVNGQQIPTFDAGLERDRLFGLPMTGIHRQLEGGIWRGKCLVHADPAIPSVAATLWREYKDSALVLDILNPKFEWQDFANENTKALHYIAKMIIDISKIIEKSRQLQPKFFITGYSRGGIFALRLTKLLKTLLDIKAVVTLDPVISEISEADSMCVGWGIKENTKWKIIWEQKLAGIHLGAQSFPILENPGVPCYNVFQRKSFLAFNSILEKPIGSAVHGAKAPDKLKCGIKPLATRTPFDQYDLELNKHSAVMEKYASWILEIARRELPKTT